MTMQCVWSQGVREMQHTELKNHRIKWSLKVRSGYDLMTIHAYEGGFIESL